MKVVVTGAAGMIGANLLRGLNAIGVDDIVAVDDLHDGAKYVNLSGARISDYFDRREFYDRFARAIATLVNILDPDVIVMGGGLSNIESLYRELPRRVEAYAFTPEGETRIVKNMHGDSSGVRGAAWLWVEGDSTGLPT